MLVAVVPPWPTMCPMLAAVDLIDEEVADFVFRTPGRNEPCHCGSGTKYKKCHLDADQAAWRAVAARSRQADAALAVLRTLPPTGRRELDPEPP